MSRADYDNSSEPEESDSGHQTRQRQQASLDDSTGSAQQIDERTDSSPSTEPHTQRRRSTSEMEEGIVFVSDGKQTTLEQTPPDRGIVIVDDEPLVVGEDRYEAVQEKLAEMGYDESDIIDNIDAALERLEELEAAAAVFQNAD